LRSHEITDTPTGSRRLRSRVAVTAGAAAAGMLLLAGCGDARYKPSNGWLPSTPDTTNQTKRIIDLWNGSWIAALVVGCLVWGLTIWCIVAYRRRRGDTGLPAQIRYHLPIEIFYTIVPLVMVGVLFFYTARDQAAIADTSAKPDVTVNVVGKQWAWDFNYVDSNVYDSSAQVTLTGKPVPERELPTLYLPQGKRVEFVLNARDVIHSFWIPAFLYKLDMIPGLTNRFQVVPGKLGTYEGKCAELCGEYHSEMLFQVKVVTPAEYDQHMADLKAKGQVGQLSTDLGRSDLVKKTNSSEGNK